MDRLKSHLLPVPTPDSPFDLPSLLSDPLLQACFQETLRLRTQNASVRVVYESTTLPVAGKTYYLRKDSIVAIPVSLIHLDEDIYQDAGSYVPERFLGADLESALIVVDGWAAGEEVKREKKPLKFFKKGRPVKHYMMPFGGGNNLVRTPFTFACRYFVCPLFGFGGGD